MLAPVVLLACLGLRRGWPREALSLAALLLARALSAASPERVRALLDAIYSVIAALIGRAAGLVGLSPAVASAPAVSAPDARTLVVLSALAWLIALPIGNRFFPRGGRGTGALLGMLLGAVNGLLLALALEPL